MIVLAAALIGAIWGVIYVRKRNGNRLDMLQYGAVWALIGAILGLVATIGLEKFL